MSSVQKWSRVPKEDAMKYEALRLGSFQSFPSSVPVSSLHLASAGFFYANVGDEVECYSCGLKLKDWSVTDNPFVVHKRYSQSCPFITNNVSDNVPLASRVNDINPVDKATENLMPLTNDFNRLATGCNDGHIDGQMPVPQSDSGYIFNRISSGNKPLTASSRAQTGPINTNSSQINTWTEYHCNNERYERARLDSFNGLSSNDAVLPQDLTRSGLYFTGISDRVQCTFCHGILRNWEEGDEPETEHRGHFGQCPFVNRPLSDSVFPHSTRNSISDYTLPKSQPETRGDYKYGRARIDSFNGLSSNDAVLPQDLTRSGLYFTGISDRVQCTFCHGILRNWEEGDEPETEHRGHFGQCPFVNRPLSDSVFSHSTRNSISDYTLPKSKLETREDYKYERARLESFKKWPSNSAVCPEDFAKSGFYYTGHDDRVQCTFCRGILMNWEPGDQPEAEHRRHFGQCPFLNSPYDVGNVSLGDEYGRENKNNRPPRIKHRNIHMYDVDLRKLKEHMNGHIVAAVRNMGCVESKIKEAVQRRMQQLGDDFFPNAESLLDAIDEYENESQCSDMYWDEDSMEDEQGKFSFSRADTKKEKSNTTGNSLPNNDALVAGNTEPLAHCNEGEDSMQVLHDGMNGVPDSSALDCGVSLFVTEFWRFMLQLSYK